MNLRYTKINDAEAYEAYLQAAKRSIILAGGNTASVNPITYSREVEIAIANGVVVDTYYGIGGV